MSEETRCNICEALVGDSPHVSMQCISVWKLRYESSSDALKEVIAEYTKQSEELGVLKLAEGLQNPVYEQLVADREASQQQVKAAKDLYDTIIDMGITAPQEVWGKVGVLGRALSATFTPVGETCSSCDVPLNDIHTPECTLLTQRNQPEEHFAAASAEAGLRHLVEQANPHQPETQTACPDCNGNGLNPKPSGIDIGCYTCKGSGTLAKETE